MYPNPYFFRYINKVCSARGGQLSVVISTLNGRRCVSTLKFKIDKLDCRKLLSSNSALSHCLLCSCKVQHSCCQRTAIMDCLERRRVCRYIIFRLIPKTSKAKINLNQTGKADASMATKHMQASSINKAVNSQEGLRGMWMGFSVFTDVLYECV